MQHVIARQKLRVSACLIGPLSLALSFALFGQAERARKLGTVKTAVAEYDASGKDGPQVLMEAAAQFGVPIGIGLGGGASNEQVSVHVSNVTVGDLFSAIVAQMPGYRWGLDNDVVNVLPEDSENSILDIFIRRFHIKKATPIQARTAITSLTEVKDWLSQNHVTERSTIVIIAPQNRSKGSLAEPRASVDLRNITLRRALNAIVKNVGWTGWSVSRYGGENQYLNIQID